MLAGLVPGRRDRRRMCAILFGDDPDALVRDLQDRFPQREADRWRCRVRGIGRQVIALRRSAGRRRSIFRSIPGHRVSAARVAGASRDQAGSTATYAAIAQRIGQPRAVRAVAQACAQNPVALAIPCHRVIRTDGALSGYRWGVERNVRCSNGRRQHDACRRSLDVQINRLRQARASSSACRSWSGCR